MEERIQHIGRTAWWLVGIALATAVLGLIGWYARVIVAPLVLAGAITFVLNPVVTRLHGRGLPRLVGTAVAYAVVAGIVVLTGVAVAPVVTDQVSQLSKDWPDVRADIEERINDLAAESVDNDWPIKVPSVQELEDEVGGGSGEATDLGSRVTSLGNVLSQVFHIGLILVLGPIIAFYLLMDLPHIRKAAEELVPARSHGEVMVIAHRLNLAVGGFFRGQLLVALIVGAMVSLGLLAVGLPAWLIVGMIAGLFNMVPPSAPTSAPSPASSSPSPSATSRRRPWWSS